MPLPSIASNQQGFGKISQKKSKTRFSMILEDMAQAICQLLNIV